MTEKPQDLAAAFLARVERYWAKSYGPGQVGVMLDRLALRRYSQEQLDRLFSRLVEDSEFFPKLAKILDCADSIGLDIRNRGGLEPARPWTRTNCQHCHGEGTFWRDYELVGTRLHLLETLPQNTAPGQIYPLFFRCTCERGAMSRVRTAQFSSRCQTLIWSPQESDWFPEQPS